MCSFGNGTSLGHVVCDILTQFVIHGRSRNSLDLNKIFTVVTQFPGQYHE
jgi:hypothetical protein